MRSFLCLCSYDGFDDDTIFVVLLRLTLCKVDCVV